MFEVKPHHRVGWYSLYTSFQDFEYNPFASVQQATAQRQDIRKPLYKVFLSNGEIVVYRNQKPVTNQHFWCFKKAFEFVESQLEQTDIFAVDFQCESLGQIGKNDPQGVHTITSTPCRHSENF